jgi:integrase
VPLKELKPPDPDQVVRVFHLAQESDPELAIFIMLAASSGARRGELLALRWSDVDRPTHRRKHEKCQAELSGLSSPKMVFRLPRKWLSSYLPIAALGGSNPIQ